VNILYSPHARLLTSDASVFRPAIDIAVHLAEAMLCAECDAITPASRGICCCGSKQRSPLARIVESIADRKAA